MGGEKGARYAAGFAMYGSPPHGRGKGEQEKTPCAREGITPAWAGKSGSRAVRPSPAGDHPRVGGEKLTTCGTRSLEMGSPPHRRGKENRVRVTGLNLRITPARRGKGPMPFLSSPSARITPAWAGKSEIRPVSFHFHRDHPRIGGEKGLGSQVTQLSQGSPPHRRGKGHACHQATVAVGITPA